MYFFYIDESGSRDPQVYQKKSDGTVAHKDHIYVLTAISLYEWKWRHFDRQIASLKLELRDQLYRARHLKFDLADCEVKSNWIRNFKYHYFRELLPYFCRCERAEQLDGLKVFPTESELVQFAREGWTEFKTEQPTLWSQLKK